ncbi:MULTISPECIES: rhomboid family intramembrane serine protease [Actinoplanes]|uniref:Protease n=2 Tax=Actinoplanes TaxID=1865 RepID=A0A0X3UPG6_9ACTN|nr:MULTISPECIES: rhomboid family intramembrane serine protease [Actinoplanes]KUL34478.1 protease [Actinoplanes awajinensis subsp. mycoplanecinus]GIE66486.1 rhomboid family intramembrane serine protease [Actinoplanes palleronii]
MSEAPSTATVCYRHPNQETLLRCSRCEKPICTNCMNDAPIGFHCPDCVKEGRRNQRRALNAFGGSLAAGRAGYAVKTIIGINVLVMIASVIVGGPRAIAGAGGFFNLMGAPTPLTNAGEVIGRAFYTDGSVAGIAEGQWYRLVTAMFLHYGVVHLALNMSLLHQIGSYLELRFGPARFAALYLLGGLAGNVAAYTFQPAAQAAAGASTATFGLVIAIIIVNRRLMLDTSSLVPLLVTNLLFTFGVPGISIEGHLGGLAGGAAAAFVLAYAKLPNRTAKQVIGCALILAILLATAILRTHQILT